MNKIIAFRLNNKRQTMLNTIRRKFKASTITEAIDAALKHCLIEKEEYAAKLESVRGCLVKEKKSGIKLIRELRGNDGVDN